MCHNASHMHSHRHRFPNRMTECARRFVKIYKHMGNSRSDHSITHHFPRRRNDSAQIDMSKHPSVRAASLADRHAATHQPHERARISSASAFSEGKAVPNEGVVGLNSSSRRSGARSPLKSSSTAAVQKGLKPLIAPRPSEHQLGSGRAGQEAAKGQRNLSKHIALC